MSDETAQTPTQPQTPGSGSKWRRAVPGLLGFLVTGAIGFGVGQWFMTWRNEANVELPEPTGPRLAVKLRGDEPQLGPDDALVTIIEFSDYECPFCVQASEPLLEAVEDDDEVRLIFKHRPLPFHKKALPAAKAAWAAHQQDKFWEASDYLFEHKGDVSGIDAFIEKHDLDAERFQADMTGPEAAQAVDDDMLAGGLVGITGTPTFVVNGHLYKGAMPASTWEAIIDREREEAQELLDEGVAKADVYDKLMEDAVERHKSPEQKAQEPKPVPVADFNPTLGPDDALVTIVVFSDFQCPYCGRAAPVYKEVANGDEDVRVVFRNLPLPMHRQAKDAAKAALAAARQGKFWEMHDYLFEHRDDIAKEPMHVLAERAGLDVERFKTDYADPVLEQQVEQDLAVAKELGVRGTPTTYVNGRYVRGAQSADALQAVVAEERKRAQALIDQGTPRDKVYDALMAQIEGEAKE